MRQRNCNSSVKRFGTVDKVFKTLFVLLGPAFKFLTELG